MNKYVNSMRSLGIQAIMKAGQGHTGMAMSACPITYTLFTKFINISKKNPKWLNRDRFVLSAGHGSMSLYSVLHFSGFISLKEIKNHKQKGSKTPGHPEYSSKNYIDCSTGPLGQGIGMGVGMAIAQSYLENKFKKIKSLVSHYTYVLVGDGDLQEGVCYETMSLAGKLNLNKLIVLHDSNDCQLDAKVNDAFNENLELRMKSINWDYIKTSNDPIDIENAIKLAKKNKKPTFIEVKTIIGEGTSEQGSNKAHGLKVDKNEISLFEKYYDIKVRNFKFDKSIYNHFISRVQNRGTKKYNKWIKDLEIAKSKYPKLVKELLNNFKNKFINIDKIINLDIINKNQATRDYVGQYFQQLYKSKINDTLFGSADLASATKTTFNIKNNFNSNKKYPEILYGIREFGMSSIQNGILLHGGLRSISSTFLSFADYMKSAIRIGAMMELPSSYIFTHDSYQVGGDGPTHQPYDQLPMLRSIQNVYVYRPCNEIETKYVFSNLFSSKNETSIGVFTRQPLNSNHPTDYNKCFMHGYELYKQSNPDIILCGSGSEIDLLFSVKKELENNNIKSRIVSIPCLQKFFNNDNKYISNLLKSKYGVFSIETSSDYLWYKIKDYIDNKHVHFGAYSFGESMDGKKLYEEKGFNKENIINIIKNQILK